jgi:hypothetical protein
MLGSASWFHYYFCFITDWSESRIKRSFHPMNACATRDIDNSV